MKKIDGSHHGVKVSDRDRRMIMQWLDASAPYAGTYAALGSGFVGGAKSHRPYNPTWERDATRAAQPALKARCSGCHVTLRAVSDGQKMAFKDEKDRRNNAIRRFDRQTVFNLSHPEKSLYLKAPLAKEAGGLGLCTNAVGKAVFASVEDPDYRKLLAMVEDAKAMLEADPRFDMPKFCPNPEYLREMKRFGVLPPDFDPRQGPVDPYVLDRQYWSLDWTDLK